MTKLLRSIVAPMFAVAVLTSCSGGGDKGVTNPGGGTVTPVLTKITVSGGTSTTIGGTLQLTAAPKDQNGAAINAAVTWSTSSAFVATVSSTGLVTGVAAGQVTITAISGSVSEPTVVLVASGAPATAVTVNMPGTSFSPAVFDIAQTGTVTFIFPALAHNVVFGGAAGAPADVPIVSNTTVTRTFATKGTFNFSCTIHSGMNGTVTVK
jgi:plastocyanin